MGIRIELDVGHAGKTGLDLQNVLLEQLWRDPRLDAEDELLTLFLGLDGLRRELCDVGDKCGFGRNHILGNGVEHDAHIAADGNTASLRRRQKERHVDVTEIDHVQDAPAGRENLAWLSDTILHPPIARRFQNAVVDVGGNAFYRGPCRINGGIRIDNLGLGGADGGFGSGKLGLRGADGGLRPCSAA